MVGTFGPQTANFTTTRPAADPIVTGSDTFFKDCSSATTPDGTVVSASWLNAITSQLRHAIRNALGSANDADDDQLSRAIQSFGANYAVAGGTVNAITVALPIAPAALINGMPVRFLAAGANTSGAVTVNVNGLGAKTLTRLDGSALKPNDIPGVCFVDIAYDGTNYRMLRMVASDIGTLKSPFNEQFTAYAVRTSLSGTGFVDLVTGGYTKQSPTSNIRVAVTTNLFSGGGAAGGQVKTTVGGSSFTIVGENMTSVANKASFNGASLITGLGAGALTWKLQVGRSDGTSWTSIANPNSSDSSNIPAATNTTVEIFEIEP